MATTTAKAQAAASAAGGILARGHNNDDDAVVVMRNLRLGGGGGGDGEGDEGHPRKLVPLPPIVRRNAHGRHRYRHGHRNPSSQDPTTSNSSAADYALAYGGDDGTVSLVPLLTNHHATNGTQQQKNNDDDKNIQIKVARRFDDPVRALAVSPDGLRVAVGFDDGSTTIFAYDSYADHDDEGDNDDERGEKEEETILHPFVRCASSSSSTAKAIDDEADEAFDGLLSQDDGCDGGLLGSQGDDEYDDGAARSSNKKKNKEVTFPGPRFDAPVRDLAFDPRSGGIPLNTNNKKEEAPHGCYHLAISTESSPGFCIVDVASADSLTSTGRLLEDLAESNHDQGGVRSLSYSPLMLPNAGHDAEKDKKKKAATKAMMMLATLGMDGRLCLWDVSSPSPHGGTTTSDDDDDDDDDLMLDDDEEEKGWHLLRRDPHKVIPKSDPGELLGADPYDRSVSPVWTRCQNRLALALPGKNDVQLRFFSSTSSSSSSEVGKQSYLFSEVGGSRGNDGAAMAGHSDAIVSMAFLNDDDDRDDGSRRRSLLVTSGRDGRVALWELDAPAEEEEETEETTTPGRFMRQLFGPELSSSNHNRHLQTIPTSILWHRAGGKDEEQLSLHMALADGNLVTWTGNDLMSLPTKTSADGTEEVVEGVEIEVDEIENEARLETQPPPSPPRSKVNKSKKLKKKRGDDQNDPEEEEEDDDVLFDDDDANAGTGQEGTKEKAAESNPFVADEAEEDDEDDGVAPQPAAASEAGEGGIDNDDDATVQYADARRNDDDGVIEQGADDAFTRHDDDDTADAFGRAMDHDDDDMGGGGGVAGAAANYHSLPDPQPAFVPSSTPIGPTRRILCWNHVGVATSREAESGMSTIDINFMDVLERRPSSFTDNLGFIAGSLGEEGAIFVTDLTGDDDYEDGDDDDDLNDDNGLGMMSEATRAAVRRDNKKRKKKGGLNRPTGSSVYFHRFETFGRVADKDWHLTLPDGERALGCACGEGWAAVVTSRRFLRLFTSGGNQGSVVWLEGDPVTVVGRGLFLAVVYHESMPLPDGTQRLGYALIHGITGNVLDSGSVAAISGGASLTWAGFSEHGVLTAMDSDGMLSMLVRQVAANANSAGVEGMGQWTPMLDTVGLRKSADDSFWPVSVQDGKLVCVPLKGGNEHPDAVRRPVTTTLPLRMPLAKGASAKSTALEELSVRANIALTQKKIFDDAQIMDGADSDELMNEYDRLSAQVDKVTMKLFIAVCEAGKVERALDLVERLHTEKSLDLAVNIADRLNHRKLSDRIFEVKERKFPLPDDVDDDDEMGEFDDEAQRPETTDYNAKRVSPDTNSSRNKRTRDTMEHHDESDDESTDDRHVQARTDDRSSKRRLNPFAKKHLESPGKLLAPPKSPSKLTLSRTSTFSAKSRAMSRGAKRIV